MNVLVVILFAAVAVTVVPLVAIWSLNTLFGLSIVMTWKTWFAALLLCGIISGSDVSIRKT